MRGILLLRASSDACFISASFSQSPESCSTCTSNSRNSKKNPDTDSQAGKSQRKIAKQVKRPLTLNAACLPSSQSPTPPQSSIQDPKATPASSPSPGTLPGNRSKKQTTKSRRCYRHNSSFSPSPTKANSSKSPDV